MKGHNEERRGIMGMKGYYGYRGIQGYAIHSDRCACQYLGNLLCCDVKVLNPLMLLEFFQKLTYISTIFLTITYVLTMIFQNI